MVKLLWVIIVAGFAFAAQGERLRTFTNQQGCSVRASILQYNDVTQKILLETGTGRRVWVDPAGFVEEDLKYVEGWVRSLPFRDSGAFRVALGRRDGAWKTTGKMGFSGGSRKERSTTFALRLKNDSEVDLKNLRMEYCVFREKKEQGNAYTAIKHHSRRIGDLPAAEGREIDAVRSRCVRMSDGTSDEIVGVALRVYLPVAGGEEIMREFRYPTGLSKKQYPWRMPKKKSLGKRYQRKD